MAPLHHSLQAIRKGPLNEGQETYVGEIDPEWAVGAIANGGYLLALVVEACIQYQRGSETSAHPDPIHLTAHFVRSSFVSSFVIRVRTVKSGTNFTNVVAELVQQNETKISAHLIFGSRIRTPTTSTPMNLSPPSPYARRLPLHIHPSTAAVQPLRHTWGFHNQVRWAEDQAILSRNKSDSPTRTDENTVGGGGLEWGAWFEFMDPETKITSSVLAFLADIFLNIPTLLPKAERESLAISWYPTMTLSMEFKAPIPPPSEVHADHTVGLYSVGKFLNDPFGRHDECVEVWSAPCNIDEGREVPGWRGKQVCLAVATQMALTTSIEVNRERGKGRSGSKL